MPLMTTNTLAFAIVGHMVGDYLLQNDWLATRKKGAFLPPREPDGYRVVLWESGCTPEDGALYRADRRRHWVGFGACAIHAVLWTLAVATLAGWWSPVPLGVLFVTHFAQDRGGFVVWWMKLIRQPNFLQPPLAPWSIIVCDNAWHLVVLATIAGFFT